MPKAKSPPARKTHVRPPVRGGHTDPPVSRERHKKTEAETLPPPPLPSSNPASSSHPADGAGSPPARVSMRIKKAPSAATVDEVTADLSRDPRRER